MIKTCLICKKEFTKSYFCSLKNWKNQKYCSTECRLENLKKCAPLLLTKEVRQKIGYANRGNKNANWKGGITVGINRAEYVRYTRRKRVVLLKKSKGFHSIEEWKSLKRRYDFLCLRCKKQEPEIKLTEDHIIPLSKGGSDNIDNIQPLCGSCNSIKNVKNINYILIEEATEA